MREEERNLKKEDKRGRNKLPERNELKLQMRRFSHSTSSLTMRARVDLKRNYILRAPRPGCILISLFPSLLLILYSRHDANRNKGKRRKERERERDGSEKICLFK